ncbi:bifunctional oligoribonuclease/PAP phosphatase NrnA [Halobacillus litoralis]|uniref:DHH family phosphoesterase n=1 Tax=Halobacillus litoralis TaxID=45668 RepID=UPI001CD3E8C8|nr:bifunctional oligoribonuclease/PAP phosphatase NrnA [Halobacillus litoralis]MCA0969824.1 bifunctional oligoribonuclease/PAP phosphatase NrnA [Halobacillus litoralis]
MTKQAIFNKIKQYDTIIIHRHVRPDPDAYGSQAGLAEIIQSNYPDKNVYITGEHDASLDFLVQMDEVPDSAFEGALVIVCDTANQARIDDQRYNQGSELIKIDHHPVVDEYGDIQWVDTNASSTCEMIYGLYLHMKEEGTELSDQAARLIYAGIVGDTGRFLFPSTTTKTLSYASELVHYNFDRKLLYNELYKTPLHVAKLKGHILQNVSLDEAGSATIILSKEVLEEYGLTASETSQLVGILGDIEGILAWVFFVEEEESIRVRLRSKGPVINKIAENHNGGGHPMAAGATAGSWEETKEIAEELRDVCKSYQS